MDFVIFEEVVDFSDQRQSAKIRGVQERITNLESDAQVLARYKTRLRQQIDNSLVIYRDNRITLTARCVYGFFGGKKIQVSKKKLRITRG